MVGLHYERGRQRVNDGFINMVVHTDQGDQITLSDDVGDIVPHRLFVGQVRKYSLRVAHTMEEFFGETLRGSKVAVSVVNGSISCLVVPGFRSIRPQLAVNTSQGDVKHTGHKNRILILSTAVATASSVPAQTDEFFVVQLTDSPNHPTTR